MAAGLGFKTFTTGEVLTAGDVNGYLMQGVLVFASAAARNAAITSPQEGQFAFTKDTNGLWYYDGAAWVASGATGDIEGVTAGIGISGGGTSGTVTVTNDMATTITASGDIVVGTGSGTYDNLPIGTTDQVLTADTTVSPYKVKWAAAGGGGSNYTLLNSGGTALTGASTITVSGISAKDKVFILIDNAATSGSTTNFISLRINADSGNNYEMFGTKYTSSGSYSRDQMFPNQGLNQDRSFLARIGDSGGTILASALITGCNSAGIKPIQSIGAPNNTGFGGGDGVFIWNQGFWDNAATVTSVSLVSSSGNFTAGTLFVYTSA